jgi:hypothetical protein
MKLILSTLTTLTLTLAALAQPDPQVFIVRFEATITAEAGWDKKTDGSEDRLKDNLTFRFMAQQKLTAIPRQGLTMEHEFSSISVSGTGHLQHTDYVVPASSFELDWAFIPSALHDPDESEISFYEKNWGEFDKFFFRPSHSLYVDTESGAGMGISAAIGSYGAAARVLMMARPLFNESIVIAPGQGNQTINRTYSTNYNYSLTTATEYAVESFQGSATYRAAATILVNPPELEAVILPDPPMPLPLVGKYANWLPAGSPNASEPGTNLFVYVIIREKGSDSLTPVSYAKAKFFCHLESSNEPGVCLNWPSKENALDTPDLKFNLDQDTLTVSSDGQYAETKRSDLNHLLLVIDCFDYGAYGKLTVSAQIEGMGEVQAFLHSDKTRAYLSIPKDEDGNRIADAWEKQQIGLPQGLPADWDDAPWPANQYSKGDGISLYEKYRGFMFDKVHERLNPMVKHLFVYDQSGAVVLLMLPGHGGSSFITASGGIRLRMVDKNTWTGPGAVANQKRNVNFNTSGFGHAVDQHALHVRLQSAKNPVMPPEYKEMFEAKYGESPEDEDLRGTLGIAWPDQTAGGGRLASPKNTYLIEAYLSKIDWYTEETVKYNTWGLPAFAGFNAASAAEKDRMRTEVSAETRSYLAANSADVLARRWFHLSEVLSHELGHGVGVEDLLPPHTQGPTNCLMRYFGFDDFPRDPGDRLEISRRWTSPLQPTIFCLDPTGTKRNLACFKQIQVTDRASSLVTMALAGRSYSLPHGSPGDEAASLAAIPLVSVADANPAEIELSAELEWGPVLAGDPLWLTAQLSSPRWRQEAFLQRIQNSTEMTAPSPLAGLAAHWVDGISLNLYRIQPGGARNLVLSQDQWRNFRRELAIDGAAWDGILAARSREWMAPGEAAALLEGNYLLIIAWDGTGLIDPGALAVGGVLSETEIFFEVKPITGDTERAAHLRRVAFQKWDSGEDQLARQIAIEALALDPNHRGKEAIETAFIVASASIRLDDYLGAAQALRGITEGSPELAQTHLAEQAAAFFRLLAPELQVVSAGAGLPTMLTVIGHPRQLYALQFSEDLRAWETLQLLPTTASRFTVEDPAPRSQQSYYRLHWLPQP